AYVDLGISPRQTNGIQRKARHHAANRPARRAGESAYDFAGTRNCCLCHSGIWRRFQCDRAAAGARRRNAARLGESGIRARGAFARPNHGSEKRRRHHEDRAEAKAGEIFTQRRSPSLARLSFWVAHASRVLASASSRSRTFLMVSPCSRDAQLNEKTVLT